MNTSKDYEWFSALLVFVIDSAKDPTFKRALRSLIIFRAASFADAHKIAIDNGRKRAMEGSMNDRLGVPELRLTFCNVETLDLVGGVVELNEVWAQISTDLIGTEIEPDRPPSQTI